MTSPTVPAVNLATALKRAAVSYAVMSGPVADMNIPLRVPVGLRWEDGTPTIDIGDARTARAVAARLGLAPSGSTGPLMHTWSGVHADQRVTVIGRGRLDATTEDGQRRDAVAASRRRGLLFPVGAGWDVTA